ncbi:hypothetical protein QBC47DRAFT_349733 [Echria macrotheca]|uniref:Uncharacterized protein n=1 Tax=Echria macrotheca TaxID=438768 RepID=A0AAJ0F964_9PEZI|nr:hypothetical protein QBC47DRAFT_349733 [Echria macrotheca]
MASFECTVSWCNNDHSFLEQDGTVTWLYAAADPNNVCSCSILREDSDIAGQGVIWAFIATALLAILSTGLCLLLSRRAEGDDQHPDYDAYRRRQTSPPDHFNMIDRMARNFICGPVQHWVIRISSNRTLPYVLAACFKDLVITLADQQIVTGISLMAAALIRGLGNNKEPLSAYHLVIVSDLVWFSSNAHLLALMVIRSYNDSVKPGSLPREDSDRQKRSSTAASLIRIVLMLALAGFLGWASVWTGDENVYQLLPCPAACLDPRHNRDDVSGVPRIWMIVNLFYIFYNYPVAILMLVRQFRLCWMDKVSSKHIHNGEAYRNLKLHFSACRTTLMMTRPVARMFSADVLREIARSFWKCLVYLVACIALVIWDFLSSELIGFAEVIVWVGLGINWVRMDRGAGHELMGDEEKEKEDLWGFGQLVPLFLLILPVVQFFESYETHSRKPKEQEKTPRQSTELVNMDGRQNG